MLSRASSDAGARLRRSKSVSTVHRLVPPPEPLDPQVSQKHALAAAATAYVRAHGNSKSQSHGCDMSRAKSNASRKSEGRHFPPRESSLRQADSQKSAYISNTSRRTRESTAGSGTLVVTPTLEEKRISPPLTYNENSRPTSQPRSHRNSESSSASANQIRKARSMYYASSVQTGSPVARPAAKYLTTPPPMVTPPLPLPRPSTLTDPDAASTPLVSPRIPVNISIHESVDQARDKYLQDFQQRQLRSKPSLFFAPFKKRQDKGKSKLPQISTGSVSYDSNLVYSDSVADATLPESQPLKEKRSFSDSLKNKIRKVFRKSSNTSTSLPIQQIEASRDYFGDYIGYMSPPPPVDIYFENIPSPNDATLSRIRSRSPSLELGRPALMRSSPRRSPSPISIAPSSRVTSWANSSVCNTATNRDMKRLSVIHEAKGSICSVPSVPSVPSVAPQSPKRKPPPVPILTAFREPMPMEFISEEVSTPVDPKRVFSALMKEIEISRSPDHADLLKAECGNDVFVISNESQNIPPSPAALTVKSMTSLSSLRSGLGRAMKTTIRAVSPDPKRTEELDRSRSVRGVVRIPRPGTFRGESYNSDTDAQNEGHDDELIGRDSSLNVKKRQRNRLQRPIKIITPTPEQIERRIEKSKGRWKTPLEEDHFPFFPRSTKRTFTVTNFARRTFSKRQSATEIPISFATPEPHSQLSHTEAIDDVETAAKLRALTSPSLYSRASDGASVRPNDSVVSLNQSEDHGNDENGTAVIITSHPVKSYVIGTPSRRYLTHSTRSSKDWRAWLSSEVSELGTISQEDITIHDHFTASGHRRERAQIDDEDRAIAPQAIHRRSAPLRWSQRPKVERFDTGRTQDSASTEPKADSVPKARMVDRFPYIETGRTSSYHSNSSKTQSSKRSSFATPPMRLTPSPPVIYSDFREPVINSSNGENSKATSVQSSRNIGNELKENVSAMALKRSLCVPPRPLTRPQSLQPFHSSNVNRSHSSLAQYTTSNEENLKSKRNSSPAATPHRPSFHASKKSTNNLLEARPKSAFDLRARQTPPTVDRSSDADETAKSTPHTLNNHVRRKPITGRALEGETLRIILAGPYAGEAASPLPNPHRTPNVINAKQSSSSLALHKEPSLVFVDRSIDSVLGRDQTNPSRSDGAWTPTAGQRMAERFLRERVAGSGAGTPVNHTDMAFL